MFPDICSHECAVCTRASAQPLKYTLHTRCEDITNMDMRTCHAGAFVCVLHRHRCQINLLGHWGSILHTSVALLWNTRPYDVIYWGLRVVVL